MLLPESVHESLPAELLAMPNMLKLNNSLFEIVLPEFATAAELFVEPIKMLGTPAAVLKSRTWQAVMRLLSLPVTVPVLKPMTPRLVLVLAPSTTQLRTVLLLASLMKRMVLAAPPRFVLRK